MRVIAGEFRGRTLLAPVGDATRPITDRAKQSLFDTLTPVLDGARVYDCFAGTGSLGLEALSRGAAHATFFEADPPAIARLRRNIAGLNVAGRAAVSPGDLFAALKAPPPVRAGLIFLDPPYCFLKERPDALTRLAAGFAAHHLTPTGLLVFRHDAADALNFDGYTTVLERRYGSMAIDLLRPVS